MIADAKGGFLISQVKQVGGRVFEKILAEKNIDEFNGAQGRILYILWQEDSISIAELAKRTGLANTTLTSMLDRMEEKELLKRVFDKKDRRKNLISLTERAYALKDEYDAVSLKMNEIYFSDFTDDEIRQFESYLMRILENLK